MSYLEIDAVGHPSTFLRQFLEERIGTLAFRLAQASPFPSQPLELPEGFHPKAVSLIWMGRGRFGGIITHTRGFHAFDKVSLVFEDSKPKKRKKEELQRRCLLMTETDSSPPHDISVRF